MSALNVILVFVVAILAIFWESAFGGIRHLFGAQIDLLPALIVYASLYTSILTLSCLAVFAGLSLDSLSANPLGITVLPLFAVGFAIYHQRELILRDQIFAQFVLGLLASAVVPLMTVLLLLTAGHTPLLGWSSLWQWMVMTTGGAVATPVLFALFSWVDRAFSYRRASEISFRPDREIRRGRN